MPSCSYMARTYLVLCRLLIFKFIDKYKEIDTDNYDGDSINQSMDFCMKLTKTCSQFIDSFSFFAMYEQLRNT